MSENVPTHNQFPTPNIEGSLNTDIDFQPATYSSRRIALGGLMKWVRRSNHVDTQSPADMPADYGHQAFESELTNASPNVDKTVEVSEAYRLLDGFLSDDYLANKCSELEDKIQQNSDLSQYAFLYDAKIKNMQAGNEAYHRQDSAEERKLANEYNELERAEKVFDDGTRSAFTKIHNQLYRLDKNKHLLVDSDSAEAQALIGLLATENKSEGDSSAPYANFDATSQVEAEEPSRDEVKEFLTGLTFLDHKSSIVGGVVVGSQEDTIFEVPSSLIHHAAGFADWTGRSSGNKTWQTKAGVVRTGSLDAIQYYASLPTEIPPVEEIVVKISQDGTISCDNGEGDSHRMAAALLRGRSSMRAKSLRFVRTEIEE